MASSSRPTPIRPTPRATGPTCSNLDRFADLARQMKVMRSAYLDATSLMRQAVLLLAGLTMLAAVRPRAGHPRRGCSGAAPGRKSATAVWADQGRHFRGRGNHQRHIVMADGQALWAPGPV